MLKIKIDIKSSFIFDCDGVLIDSNRMKIRIFEKILKKNQFSKEAIVDFIHHHKKHAGISRYIKINRLFTKLKINDQSFKKNILNEISNSFKEEYMKLNLTAGCEDFLIYLKKKRINSYVLTGSDEIELNNIFRKKGIKKYFKLILGSPVNKFENFNKFSKHVNTKVPNYYFGDSRLDYQVAKKINFNFIFVKQFSDQPLLIKEIYSKCNVINNFTRLNYIS